MRRKRTIGTTTARRRTSPTTITTTTIIIIYHSLLQHEKRVTPIIPITSKSDLRIITERDSIDTVLVIDSFVLFYI